MRISILLLILLTLPAHKPRAADSEERGWRPALPGETCPIKLPVGVAWQPQEVWAWEQICLGKKADLAQYSGRDSCDPTDRHTFGETNTLSRQFVELIVRHPQYQQVLHDHGIIISCARFPSTINLSDAHTHHPLRLETNRFEGRVLFRRFKSSTVVSLKDAAILDVFDAERLQVAGDVFMTGVNVRKVTEFIRAKIGGSLHLDKSMLRGSVKADHLEVQGDLLFRNASVEEEADFTGVRTGGSLAFDGSTFKKHLEADRIRIGGKLQAWEASFQSVGLIEASIGESLLIEETTFRGLLNADGIRVASSLFLRNGCVFQDIDLIAAKVGGHLQLWGSTFHGKVDLTEAQVSQEFQLNAPGNKHSKWESGATLILRNGHAESLQDTAEVVNNKTGNHPLLTDCYGQSLGSWPEKFDIVGFTYNHLGGLAASRGSTMADRAICWYEKWFKRQVDYDEVYKPQPYEQLAKVLRENGQDAKADKILYLARNFERHGPSTPMQTKVWLTVTWAVIGYGYTVWRALIWIAGLVILGVYVLSHSSVGATCGRWRRIFYSIDMGLPIVTLNGRAHGEITKELPPIIEFYFHVHKILGFVLVSFVIAGLSGLVS